MRGTTVTWLAIVGLSGTALSGVALAQGDSERILAELRQIQAQLMELKQSQTTLGNEIRTLQQSNVESQQSMRKTIADTAVTLGSLRDNMSVVSSRLDETNQRLQTVQNEMNSARFQQQPLLVPADEGEGETIDLGADPTGAQSEPPPVMAQGPSSTDIYNQARTDYTQGRYPLAISGFKEVLSMAPRGDLADNAQYWIGECYLAQNRFQQALDVFDVVIREYPDSNKLGDAYYKKATALESMDRRSEAMVMYELIIDQFPSSNLERLARRKLESLMRTTRPN